jgi:hypothetical protein
MSRKALRSSATKNRRRCRRAVPQRRQATCYGKELLASITRWFPRLGLPLGTEDQRVCWTPRLLVLCAILMVFSEAQVLKDRFADARLATVQLCVGRHRRRPGKTYEGFIASLCKVSGQLMEGLLATLRAMVQEIAGPHRTVEGWVLFGVDGTKLECPQTQANEQGMGCAGKDKSAPQQLLTMLLHLGTGLPWGFVRGPGTGSEREQLGRMLGLLPGGSMLVADAGYTGYDMLKAIQAAGGEFLIRVGSGVKLLRKLGYAVKEYEHVVYLWPDAKQGRHKDGSLPERAKADPLVLRLIVLHDGKKTIHLLSSVLESDRLSNRTAAALYRRRWGLELYYRTLKQTLNRRKLLSDCPAHSEVELDWNVAGLWVLGLMTVQSLIASGRDPAQASAAGALRSVRKATKQFGERCGRGALRRMLALAVQDQYQRHGSKTARHRKNKKTQRPPGAPQLRLASAGETQLARRMRALAAATEGRASPIDQNRSVPPKDLQPARRYHLAA